MKDPLFDLKQFSGLLVDPDTSENRLYEIAKIEPLRILIIGRPRSGKTLAGALLAKELDVVHIELNELV